jgi:hypothetical protein
MYSDTICTHQRYHEKMRADLQHTTWILSASAFCAAAARRRVAAFISFMAVFTLAAYSTITSIVRYRSVPLMLQGACIATQLTRVDAKDK